MSDEPISLAKERALRDNDNRKWSVVDMLKDAIATCEIPDHPKGTPTRAVLIVVRGDFDPAMENWTISRWFTNISNPQRVALMQLEVHEATERWIGRS